MNGNNPSDSLRPTVLFSTQMFSSVWTGYAMMACDLLVSLTTSAAGGHVARSHKNAYHGEVYTL